MGKFESYPSISALADDDITLINHNTVTHKISFATLATLIKNRIGLQVDTHPTEDSINLATSGGIYSMIKDEEDRAINVENTKANQATTLSGYGITDAYTKTEANNTFSTLALGTTSSTAYRGDRGNAAYKHAVTNKGAEFKSGLYKITTNAEGHVTAATEVTKADITGLGIPAQDTTYSGMTDAEIQAGTSNTARLITPAKFRANVDNKTWIGTCSTAADKSAKIVSVDTGFLLVKGARIGVKFTNTNTASSVTLNVNNTGAKSIYYNNAVYTSTSNMVCGYAKRYTFYVYDGTNWVWDSYGTDANTTYSAMSESELTTGTATSQRTVRADYLKSGIETIIDNKTDTTLSTTSTNPVQNKVITNALANKVDDTDLATVAKSGSYNDLINKPTLGTAAAKNSTNAVTSGSADLVEAGAVYDALQNLPSGGGGALYFTNVACAATTGNFATKSNSAITANHVVVSVEYANPSAITSDVTWTTASGSVKLNGTCASATTCSLVLVKKDN